LEHARQNSNLRKADDEKSFGVLSAKKHEAVNLNFMV